MPTTLCQELCHNIQDEMTHWLILSPAPICPSTNNTAHFVYKAKTYGENTKIQCNPQHSETPQLPVTRQSDQYLSQLFFEKFDSVKPQLKFEPDYNKLTDVGTTYLGKSVTD